MSSNWIREDAAREKAAMQKDAAAKTAGVLEGRIIYHPYADGYAMYEIVSTTKRIARVKKLNIGDAWTLPAWGAAADIPLALAKKFIERQDWLANAFKGK